MNLRDAAFNQSIKDTYHRQNHSGCKYQYTLWRKENASRFVLTCLGTCLYPISASWTAVYLLIILTSIVWYILFLCAVELCWPLWLRGQWVTPLYWVTCSFINMNTLSFILTQSCTHSPAARNTHKSSNVDSSTAENSPQQIHHFLCLFVKNYSDKMTETLLKTWN